MAAKKSVKKKPVKSVVKHAPVKKQGSVKYISVLDAWMAFWRRGFTEWQGSSSRSEFWGAWLVNFFIYTFSIFLCAALFASEIYGLGIFVLVAFVLYAIACFIPRVSMFTRRMHDVGLSAWFWLLALISLIPLIGVWVWGVWTIVISLIPTKTTGNPYHKYNK